MVSYLLASSVSIAVLYTENIINSLKYSIELEFVVCHD